MRSSIVSSFFILVQIFEKKTCAVSFVMMPFLIFVIFGFYRMILVHKWGSPSNKSSLRNYFNSMVICWFLSCGLLFVCYFIDWRPVLMGGGLNALPPGWACCRIVVAMMSVKSARWVSVEPVRETSELLSPWFENVLIKCFWTKKI